MKPMFPFKKNRYFPYKRMRSEDFSRELEYMDHKFQCLNRWTFGAGIAFGLRALPLGDESLTVSQGMAVDRLGRYLIVDEPMVFRIKSLKNFRELTGDTALLCLRYKEELQSPMPTFTGEEERQEFAVSEERYEFYLKDVGPEPLDMADSALYYEQPLYADDSLRVRQIMPDVLSSHMPVKIRLIFENLTSSKMSVKLHYAPGLPGFHMAEQENICLDLKLDLPIGTKVEELLLIPKTTAQTVCFTLEQGEFTMELPDRDVNLIDRIKHEFRIVPGDPMEALAGRVLAMSPHDFWGGYEDDGVPIAALRLIRSEEEVLLRNMIPLYQQQKAHLPALEQRIEECRTFFPENDRDVEQPDLPEESPREEPFDPEWDRYMSTGVVTMNAGLHLRKGKVLLTGEIPHNLGTGTVYMDFGVEKVEPSPDGQHNIRSIILGDASLFIPAEDDYEHNFDRGIRIHPEKGTFELCIRLREELSESTLQLRWYAWRPERTTVRHENNGTLLRLEPSVVYAEPGQEIYFTPIFRGSSQPCRFSLENSRQAGLITPDGVYTAPEKDGLYQISAQVEEHPEMKVGAFIIVRSQEEGAEDDSEKI